MAWIPLQFSATHACLCHGSALCSCSSPSPRGGLLGCHSVLASSVGREKYLLRLFSLVTSSLLVSEIWGWSLSVFLLTLSRAGSCAVVSVVGLRWSFLPFPWQLLRLDFIESWFQDDKWKRVFVSILHPV